MDCLECTISGRCKISQETCLYIDPSTKDMMIEPKEKCPNKTESF